MKKLLILPFILFCSQVYGQQIIGRHTPIHVADSKENNWTGYFSFGQNPDIDTGSDPEGIWETGGTLTLFADDFLVDIVSTSTADDDGSTGAITVQIFGLDSSYARKSETLTMNGTGDVVSTNKYRVVYRAVVLTAGTGLTNAGVITIEDQSNVVMVTIAIGDAQSQKAVFGIAAGETAFIYSWGIDNLTASADLIARLLVYNESGTVWNEIDQVRSIRDGTSQPFRNMSLFPYKISGGALIKITVITDQDDADVAGHFTVLYR